MASYGYIISKGHHIAVIDSKLFIIDTGSPISFSFVKGITSININGETVHLKKNISGLTQEEVFSLVGLNVDGFIGTDILIKFKTILFDKTNRLITFGGALPKHGQSIPVGVLSLHGMGVISVPLIVNRLSVNSIFDTGACVGYASGMVLAGIDSVGTVTDSGPALGGEITTTLHWSSVLVNGKDFDVKLAKMPALLENTLGLLGYDVILGLNDIPGECIAIDFVSEQIVICDA